MNYSFWHSHRQWREHRVAIMHLPLLYNLSRCCTLVMAPSTLRRFTRLLMFDAVPNSSANIFATREIWSLGGIIRDITLVPLLKRHKTRTVTTKRSGDHTAPRGFSRARVLYYKWSAPVMGSRNLGRTDYILVHFLSKQHFVDSVLPTINTKTKLNLSFPQSKPK